MSESRIAQKAPYAVDVEAGRKYFWCACGRSGNQREELNRRLHERRIVPVHLSRQEVKQSYEGFSNAVIWPLFHYRADLAVFDRSVFEQYQTVNELFAEQLARIRHDAEQRAPRQQQANLDQEYAADDKLSKLAESTLNRQAA